MEPTQYVLDRLPNGVHEQGTRMAFFFTAVPRAEYEYSRVLYCTIACPSGFRHGLIYPYISCVTLPNAAHQHRRPTRAPQKRLTSSPRVQHVQRVGTLGTRVVRDTRVRTRHDLRRTHEIASQRPKIAAHETASRQTIALPIQTPCDEIAIRLYGFRERHALFSLGRPGSHVWSEGNCWSGLREPWQWL